MNDTENLQSRQRTATSAYVVNMWHVPEGADPEAEVILVSGFFDESEKAEAETLVTRNAIAPARALMCPIKEFDAAMARQSKIVENALKGSIFK
jgi:hypothetical protein